MSGPQAGNPFHAPGGKTRLGEGMLIFTDARAQCEIACLHMMLRRRQRAVGAVHNVAFKQELTKLRLFNLQHFAQLAETERIINLDETIEKLSLWRG